MLDLAIAFVAGLLIGWNVFPQPAWVKRLWDKALGRDA